MRKTWYDKQEEARVMRLLALLKERFTYDPVNGGFVGLEGEKRVRFLMEGTKRVYKELGSTADMVWLWHHGELPPAKLLHRDGFWFNNRIDNLGMILCDGHVEGCGDEWHIRSIKKQMVTFHSTHRTWQEAVAAYECRDLV